MRWSVRSSLPERYERLTEHKIDAFKWVSSRSLIARDLKDKSGWHEYKIDLFKWVSSRSLIARDLKDKSGWLNTKLMLLNKFQGGH